MDDYSSKIKNSAEHLIRVEFPEKALELDTLVSVCFHLTIFHYFSFFLIQSPILSFNEVSKIRDHIQLPTADDIIAHLTNGTDHPMNSGNGESSKKSKTESTDHSNSYVFNGSVPSNPLISILEDKLRPYILHFLDSVQRMLMFSFN